MELEEFCRAVYIIGHKYAGSITSWGRTVKHSIAVGGFNGDPHTWWMGVDMIYDSGPNNTAVDTDAKELGLRVLHEKGHDHYQPIDWVNQAIS